MAPSFKLMTLALLCGAAAVGACGDDGNVLGSAGDAGSAGQTSGGSAGTAASGAAGLSTAGSDAAGTSSGGTVGGAASTAGTSSGGKSSGGTSSGGKEQIGQGAAGGQGAGGSGQECVGMTCAEGEACVAHRTVGGAVVPPSAGGCMTGKHLEDASCQNDFKYACAALTCTAIGSGCRCAPDTSCAYTNNCRSPQAAAWLDTDAGIVCEQQVP
jgi:hypothetical protein